MKRELVVVANATKARFFARRSDDSPLVPSMSLARHCARSQRHANSEDGFGGEDIRAGDDGGAAAFAGEVDRCIAGALATARFRSLVLFAPSPFLGHLRLALSLAAASRLRVAADVDLTPCDLGELQTRIFRRLHPAGPVHREYGTERAGRVQDLPGH